MREWRADFRQMADEIREENRPVARLLEHIGDLGSEQVEQLEQLEAGPWKRDLEALEYDELTRASAILHRLRDRARDTNRADYVEGLDRILATVEAEVRRRAEER